MGGVSAAVSKTAAAPIERVKLLIQNQVRFTAIRELFANVFLRDLPSQRQESSPDIRTKSFPALTWRVYRMR